MNPTGEMHFFGIWRSFKIFKPSGAIKFSTPHQFIEMTFRPDRMLEIKQWKNGYIDIIAETDSWRLISKNKKQFLTVVLPRISYEVITIDHKLLVLLDSKSDEKIFFARVEAWPDHLDSTNLVKV